MGFPFKIATIYAIFSVLWITLSDQLVAVLFADNITQVQTYKGWAFVFFSSLLILILLSQELARRNRVEDKLKQDKSRLVKLSQAVSQSPVSVIITDTTGIIEYVNDAFERITGFSREEALGK